MKSNALLPKDRSALRAIRTLIKRTEALRQALERETASGFSPFAYLATGELGLSRILADLLDPAGPHGQGAVFLEDFLSRIGLAGRPSRGAAVEREAVLDGCRRIDILVRGEGWVCAIENKPTVIDQPAQLADYYDWIRGIAGQQARLVYLSGSAAPPAEISLPSAERERLLDEEKLFLFGFSGANPEDRVDAFDDVLASWRGLARPLRLQMFIEDCRRFLAQTFAGEKDPMTQEANRALARDVLEEPELASAALRLLANAANIQAEVFGRFFAAIERKVEDREPGVEIVTRIRPEDLGQGAAHLAFRPATPRSPVWKESGLAVTIEVPRRDIAFFGSGRTDSTEPGGSAAVLESPAFEVIRSHPALHGARSTVAYGWPFCWRLQVTDSDRLQDLDKMKSQNGS